MLLSSLKQLTRSATLFSSPISTCFLLPSLAEKQIIQRSGSLVRLLSSGGDTPKSGNDKDGKIVPKKKEHQLQNLPKGGQRLPGAEDFKNPWEVLKYESHFDAEDMVPRHTDILIIGGGVMGWSVAYWLRQAAKITVTVVERDPSHSRAATVLSVGGIRQQFSEPENIQMSMFGAEFLRNIREHLSVLDHDPPDIQFSPQGYLLLASDKGAEQMHKNFRMQQELGAKVELLSKEKIKERWPWINVSDVELGCYGFENEGWFDPYLLLQALRRKAASLGVQFVVGELTNFEYDGNITATTAINMPSGHLKTAIVRTPDGNLNPISFSKVVNAAGPWAGEVARMAEIGVDGGIAGAIPLPVEPRKRFVYSLSCRGGFPKTERTPLLVDCNGVYMRREGTSDCFLTGMSPRQSGSTQQALPSIDTPWLIDSSGIQMRRHDLGNDFIVFKDPPPLLSKPSKDEPAVDDLEVDYAWFDEEIWPRLAHRVPAMQAVKVRNAWAGFYDYNYVDQNLIIGNHPIHRNMVFVNGSSGHGIQHAVAIGRAVMELVFFDGYKTIQLDRFSFDRIMKDQPVFEKCIF